MAGKAEVAFELETQRLLLRDFSARDTAAYVTLSSDAKYQKFYSEVDCTVAKAVQLVEMFIKQARQRPRTHYQLAISLKGDSGIIGTCGMRT